MQDELFSIVNLYDTEKKEIIEKYISYREKATYLFPILDARLHKTPMQKKNRVRKVLARINVIKPINQ